MSKGIKGLIIAGGISIGLGLISLFVGLAISGFSIETFLGLNVNNKTYVVESTGFTNIQVDEKIGKIAFVLTDDYTCRVECNEIEKIPHLVKVENGTLFVTAKDHRKWYDKIGFLFYDNVTTTIYLPYRDFGNIKISSAVGSIVMPESFSFINAVVESQTGAIKWYSNKTSNMTGDLTITSATGSVIIENGSFGAVNVTTATGVIKISNVSAVNQISTKAATGSTFFTDVNAENLKAEVNTGSLNITRTFALGDFNLKSDTGSIVFDHSDANNIYAETDTGSIKGSLLSSKQFSAHSDTGRIKVPESDITKGICKLKTDTGSIIITIAK